MVTKDEALKLALEALENSNSTSYEMLHAIVAIKEALAQPEQEPHNFCPRCGKRLQGVLGQPQVHTCTPPLWGYK